MPYALAQLKRQSGCFNDTLWFVTAYNSCCIYALTMTEIRLGIPYKNIDTISNQSYTNLPIVISNDNGHIISGIV